MYLQDKIEHIINKQKNSFALNDILSQLHSRKKVNEKIVEDVLEESYSLFEIDNNEKPEKKYYPRHVYFNNSNFLISPTKEEINCGILIPGHRFIPFYHTEELFPGESFTIETHDNETISFRQNEFKLKQLFKYYHLLGAENIAEHFIAEHNNNKSLLGNPENKIKISVFDLKNYFKRNSFTENDFLKFKVKDWTHGNFEISIIAKKDLNNTDDFIEEMEESLYKVFNKHGQWLELTEQLALAYFYLNDKYLKTPELPITDFISMSEAVAIKHFENNTILWHNESAGNEESENNSPLSISEGNIDSLNEILNEINDLASDTEFTAFIKQAVNDGNSDPEKVLKKLLPNKAKFNFKDKAQETAFKNHYEELFENISENCTEEPHGINELRSKILDCLEDFYRWHAPNEQKINETGNNALAPIKQNLLFIRKFLQHIDNEFISNSPEEMEQLDNLAFSLIKQLNDEIDNLKALL